MSMLYLRNKPIGAISKVDNGSVSVTADGVKTFATLLNELQALVDYSKVSLNAVLVTTQVDGEITIYRLSQYVETNGQMSFDRTRVYIPSTFKITSYTYVIDSNNSHVYYAHYNGANYSFGDSDASVPVSGIEFTLYY